jgi:hypothetical protein
MDTSTEPLFPQITQNGDDMVVISEKSSEIVIAFVGAVGVNLSYAEKAVERKLEEIGFIREV